jgi:chemotaxis protein MotA
MLGLIPSKSASRQTGLDLSMLLGIAVAALALALGIAQTSVSLDYFLQPTGFFIVVVGTIGVTLATTPRVALGRAARRVVNLVWPGDMFQREELIEEIVSYARISRTNGILALEPIAPHASNVFLHSALLFALDVKKRAELQSALEDKVRLSERQGDADARVFESAGGFAPAIGVMGTVVGLIDALRRFTDIASVAPGMGVAFVSTVYGLALANLVLLPLASRIRASVAETFEMETLMTEGVLCVFDGIHPQLIRQRLASVDPESPGQERFSAHAAVPAMER